MRLQAIYLFTSIFISFSIYGQDTAGIQDQKANLHFQTTYIYQYKPPFYSRYQGVNSLSPGKEEQNSLTATLYFGFKLFKHTRIFINPELAGGSGLSGALGLGGSSNGETFRVGNPSPTLYLARAFIVQDIYNKGPMEKLEEDANQLQGSEASRYLRLYAGKFSLGDIFDNNNFSNSPRTQFLNWSLMNNGAWDYAANVRGYTYALALALKNRNWMYKISAASLPETANGPKLNVHLNDSFAIALNAEVDKRYSWHGNEGNLRFLLYYNQTNMGNYNEAIKSGQDIADTRKLFRHKIGAGFSWDQAISSFAGLFGRLGWNDGKNETWNFTEIDRTVSLGISYKGTAWKRKDDNAGMAMVINGLSKDHITYLQNGGSGFILGDGALNYRTEIITELFYQCKPAAIPIWLTGDYQFILNPGFNKDRGPAHIFSIRMHCAL